MKRSAATGRPRRISPTFVQIERLEGRQLMTAALNSNLIVNPGAETVSNGLATGWTVNSTPEVVAYGTGGFPTATSPGPSNRGNNFFAGGNDAASDFFQTINISNLASSIDAGKVKYALDGWLGGYDSQDDSAEVFINFQSSSKGFVDQASIGPVLAADRQDVTGLFERKTSGTVPAGARYVQVQIHMTRSSGSYNDGYADNLSLTLTSTANLPATLSGVVYNDANGDGAKSSGEAGLGGVKVFIDANNNGKQDSTDPFTTTSSNGSYSFANAPLGAHNVYVIAPSGYRVSGANPVAETFANGSASTANFFVSQTALISGTVFNDLNGDKVQDGMEKGLSGITVYLDFNNNGQLDSFELKTTTDSSGHFKFVVPFGTYVVRAVVPAGKVQTTPASAFTVTLSKGEVAPPEAFGVK